VHGLYSYEKRLFWKITGLQCATLELLGLLL
jgi:hypothetical protein